MRFLSTGLLSVTLAGAAFTQGDDCSTAMPISGVGSWAFDTTTNSTSGFMGAAGCLNSVIAEQDVFWQWTAQAPGTYSIDTCGSNFDTVTAAHAGVGCNATCTAFDDLACGLNSQVYVTNANAGDTYLIQVGGWVAGEFGPGTLNISIDPCSLMPDDVYEDNDLCTQARALGDGVYPGLVVAKSDWDFFELTVAAGNTLAVTLDHITANGDTDVFLYDSFGGCLGPSAGNQFCNNTLVCSSTINDQESFLWSNSTGSTETYILKVNIWPPTTTGDCNSYDLTIAGTTSVGANGIGTSYCSPGVANSTGVPGVIVAFGSLNVLNNAFRLDGGQLPDGQFAYFIGSLTPSFVPQPGGSQGNLCMGGNIARFKLQIGQIALGSFSAILDLTAFPQNPTAPVQPGETWNFQCWHRDLIGGVPTSNFTDGVSVAFQ